MKVPAPDRFAAIDARLREIRNIESSFYFEKRQLCIELAVLRASSEGFRVGVRIEWDGKNGTESGTIIAVWDSSYGQWTLDVEQEPNQPYVSVGRSKKPRIPYTAY